MSGIDEIEPDMMCPRCGGREFRQSVYGYKVLSISIDTNSGKIIAYDDGNWHSDDYEEWECSACWTTLPEEIRKAINEYILRYG